MKKLIMSLLLTISCTISPVFAAPQESIEEDKSLIDYEQQAVIKVINIAKNEIGYLEKASSKNLYHFTENAGSANYTKYAHDLSSVKFYSGEMNGLPWCDMFVDWCFMQAFGSETAKQMTYQIPYGSAACASSLNFYKTKNQFFKEPKIGDQIFFSNHTGFVYDIIGSTVYTIEGNTNSSSGVVANGGAVCQKTYNKNASKILGYGRPNYTIIATELQKQAEIARENEKKKSVKAKLLKSKLVPAEEPITDLFNLQQLQS